MCAQRGSVVLTKRSLSPVQRVWVRVSDPMRTNPQNDAVFEFPGHLVEWMLRWLVNGAVRIGTDQLVVHVYQGGVIAEQNFFFGKNDR